MRYQRYLKWYHLTVAQVVLTQKNRHINMFKPYRIHNAVSLFS